ncbi:hypothetical protein AZ66_12200 [Paenibacillus sp. E194]|nr:hypothetical protein AZ66_12200 [Paenibacillus sp. E194]
MYEKEHRIRQEPWGGYVRHNVLHWAIYNETGECCEDEPIAGNEAIMMYSPLLRYGQGDIADDSSSEQ